MTDSNDPAVLIREIPGGGSLFVIDGDITNVAVDGVVSNDDVDGRMYTVIASSIKAAAGPDVERQSIAQGPFPRGDAWHTDAGRLPSPIRFVIHVAAMDRRGDTDPPTITQCVISALEEARAQELESIAIAAFGTGPRGLGPKVIDMNDWLADVTGAIIARFTDWQAEWRGAGEDLKVLIVLYGPEDLDETVDVVCKAAYGKAVAAISPPAWPGATPILDVKAMEEEIIGRRLRLVAIDGRSGAGKSTLAEQLAREWKDAVVVKMDDFRRPIQGPVCTASAIGGALEHERLVEQVLEPIRAGRDGRYQNYDQKQDRLTDWHDIPRGAIVLVEGLYSSSAPLRGYFDYAVWIDCPYETRLERGVRQNGAESAENHYIETERPIARADLVLDGQGYGDIAFRVVRRRKKDISDMALE